MKRGTLLTLFAFCLFVIFASHGYAQQTKPEHTLKIASIVPGLTTWGTALSKAADRVYERTNGKLRVVLYLGGVMGDEPGQLRKVRLGQIDGALITFTPMQVVVPELSVIELPYMFNTRDEASYVWNQFFDHFNNKAQKKNLFFTCLMEVGWWDFYTQKKVTTREELTRLKTETIGGDVYIRTFKHWDIPIIIIPPAEALPALQTGVFDAVNAPLQYLIGAQMFSELPYCLKTHWYYQHATVAMNKERLDRVPADLKKVFLEEMKNFAKEVIPVTRKSNDEIWNNMEKYGITITDPSPAVIKDFKERSRPVWDELVDKSYSRSLLNDVIKIRDEYRRKKGGE